MDAVSRQSRTAVARRGALALLCALACGAAGEGVLADPGQARDTATGGLSPSQRAEAAGAVASAAAASSRPRGMSRATGAQPPIATLDVRQPASATLERCTVAAAQGERYATFAGKMVALPGTSEMAMRIDIEERQPGQTSFRPLEGDVPGLGAWRSSEPGVKIFKDVKQVIDLEAPAAYRAVIHFRWFDGRASDGTVDPIARREVLRTLACKQPPPERQLGGEAAAARMPAP
jgi:hypothetical protein